MAKTSSVAREKRRQKLVAQYAVLRKELKAKGDYDALRKLPRDSNPTRLHNRCKITGRSRAYLIAVVSTLRSNQLASLAEFVCSIRTFLCMVITV